MHIKNYLKALKSMTLAKIGIKTPIIVYHFITNKCNLDCGFCLAKKFDKKDEMSTEEVKQCMDEFKKAGTQLWDFCGGEPLLRKDIPELIKYSKRLGFIVSIVTNGTFIDKYLNSLLKTDSIMISLDGPKEIHNKIRGVSCYDSIIKNIDLLVKYNKKPIINMVINKDNLNYVGYMVEFAKQHKCPIDFSLVVANSEEINKYILTKDQINNVINKLLKLKKQNPHIITSTYYLKRILKYKNNKVKKFQPKCLAGKTFCVLAPEGEVALCVDMFKKGFNGKEHGFYNAFKKLNYPSCDCNFRCYFNTNNLHSLKPSILTRAFCNAIRGRPIHS